MGTLYRSFPNQFANSLVSTTSTVANGPNLGSTGSLYATLDFGFQAALMKIIVNSGTAYLQLNGQTATTNDYQLTTGDTLTDWYDVNEGMSGISVCATSTAMSLRLGSWG
jgi:hypothetical protein